MSYKGLSQAILDLESTGQLIRITDQVDPYLEMAAIHLEVNKNQGPAVLFENIKGCKFPAVSNLYGTMHRCEYLFRDSMASIERLFGYMENPKSVFSSPFQSLKDGLLLTKGLPRRKSQFQSGYKKIQISDLPQIHSWPKDGGAFITLPQVYSEDPLKRGVMNSNIGMYRIQISGNEYITNKEVGLHYQLHRGIGVHQTKSQHLGEDFQVSIFVGGPPSCSVAAVMPLPEAMPELSFSGILGKSPFKYYRQNGFVYPYGMDFIIHGVVKHGQNKPEGPFGDHLGYYSLKHDFPVLQVKEVWAKNKAIWPFTVVGRPPQEDSQFGAFIHKLLGKPLLKELPGLVDLNAVDLAGVHPLLFASAKERYTPYLELKQPQEILTIANHILGKGQLSLAKFVIIQEHFDSLSPQNEQAFFHFFLERVNWKRDLHFYTNTTIDTLDYSGEGINIGSKVVMAAINQPLRKLGTELKNLADHQLFDSAIIYPGILAVENKKPGQGSMEELKTYLEKIEVHNPGIALAVWVDSVKFVGHRFSNFLWTVFTRSNPAKDIDGVASFVKDKHWGCEGMLIINAKSKPHHAPELVMDPKVMERVKTLAAPGKALHGII